MKKFISILMLLAVLFSLCACGGQTDPTTEPTETTAATEPTKDSLEIDMSPEALYGHIDQTKPNDKGVYKIWNADGVKNMVNVPDGTFELLCNVDMEGATLTPIGTEAAPFTGTINGANFIISNFSLTGGEVLGFVGVNQGTIQDLQLSGVTVTADETTKAIGTLAGINEKKILRSKATGAVNAEAAAADAACGGAIGQNKGDFTNSTVTVDVSFASTGAASVGGIVGATAGGKIEYIESYGAITVTGEAKTVGLFAGAMEGTTITSCYFVGADNSLNGELFTALSGTGDQALITECRMRDNTPVIISEASQKLRDKVVAYFNEFGSIEWKVDKVLEHESGVWSVGTTYFGSPYKHAGSTMSSLKYMIGEDGYVKDFVYDMDPLMIQDYMGTDCSTALGAALWTVSNSTDFYRCTNMYPWMPGGCLYVGDWEPDPSLSTTDSQLHIKYNGEDRICEAYAQLKKGDFYVYHIPDVGGHTRMASANAVVVRDQNGKIDPNYSYVPTTEQGWTTSDSVNHTHTTCRVEHNYTFANLLYDGAVPITCEELVTGEMEEPTYEFVGAQPGRVGLTTGTVKTNYHIESVTMVITDSKGNEVFNHVMFPSVGKVNDSSDNTSRSYFNTYDMGRFATPLSEVYFDLGETYNYTVDVYITPGETFRVHESSFTYGSAD